MSVQAFSRAALPAMPWKNGGGSTQQIASWPAGAGFDEFGWRVSIACIAAPGPFSVFAGIDRSIMLLEGDGVRLFTSGDGRIEHRLDQPHVPFAFSGDEAVDCALLGGASHDFNVMTRRGQWRAEVRVLAQAATLAAAPHGVLLALRGGWRLNGEEACREGEGRCWEDEPRSWHVEPESAGARLAAVSIMPA